MRVVVCTGRGLVECRRYLDAIGQRDAAIVAGGSIIADPTTSRTIHRFAMDLELVRLVVDRLIETDHPALVLKDPLEAGYDYLVVRGPRQLRLDPVMDWWFDTMSVRVRTTDHLHEDEHPEHTVRVGAFGYSDQLHAVAEDLRPAIEGRGHLHNFPAVVGPEHLPRLREGQSFHILELFNEGADKWSAIRWLAERDGIDPRRVATIGDEVNDISMIRGAGLGIAMGNAIEPVRNAAKRHAPTNNDDGVAHAIGEILSGRW